jgi:hypothetical protein
MLPLKISRGIGDNSMNRFEKKVNVVLENLRDAGEISELETHPSIYKPLLHGPGKADFKFICNGTMVYIEAVDTSHPSFSANYRIIPSYFIDWSRGSDITLVVTDKTSFGQSGLKSWMENASKKGSIKAVFGLKNLEKVIKTI